MIREAKIPSFLTKFPTIHPYNFSSFVMDVFRNYFGSETAFSDWQPKPLMPPISSFSGVELRWGGRQTKVGWGQPTLVWPDLRGTACVLYFTVWQSYCTRLYDSVWSPDWWDHQDYWSRKAFPGVIRKKMRIHCILLTLSVKFYSLIV